MARPFAATRFLKYSFSFPPSLIISTLPALPFSLLPVPRVEHDVDSCEYPNTVL
jgi:hypothetical protein